MIAKQECPEEVRKNGCMKTYFIVMLISFASGAWADVDMPVWPPSIVDAFATIPVQESGRIKPLDSVARFSLLRLNGKRTLTLEGGQSRSAMEWMLDCFFFPEYANTCRCFTVESHDAIIALGLEPRGKKRDRYSYEELQPGLDHLMDLAQQVSDTPAGDRSFLDTHLLSLANNVLAYESLVHYLDFARVRFNRQDNPLLSGLDLPGDLLRLSEVLSVLPGQLTELAASSESMSDGEKAPVAQGMREIFSVLDEILVSARLFAMIAPEDSESREWLTPADIVEGAFDSEFQGALPVDILRNFEELAAHDPSTPEFTENLSALHAALINRAIARNEYRHIPLEVHYYRFNYLFFALWLFVLSFIMIACSWLQKTPGRFTKWINFSLLPPLLLLAVGITLRCIIRERPPVTTLYETILFSVFVAVLLGFITELISKNRIGMSVAALLGALGMFLAWRYEANEGTDTMPAVVAVLDTNFWLATHVTTIVVGYGAGLFASALGHVYVVARITGMKRKSLEYFTDLSRIIYGVLAFCLVFTLIGTVLGGVWAAQSWGRFWGWDPKENGALMIVLWALAVLHARRGGYIRRDGLALSAIVLGMIVVFAWWGVNALGVGLHSYGFTSGIWQTLAVFWFTEIILLAAGLAAFKIMPLARVST